MHYDAEARFRRSLEAASEIVAQHCDPALAKPERLSRITYTILAAIYAAEADLNTSLPTPSKT
jgi:hypothetical protein